MFELYITFGPHPMLPLSRASRRRPGSVSTEDLGILLRQLWLELWLYMRLMPLGRLPLQEVVILFAASFAKKLGPAF
jgi:hypothetical protein